MKLCRRTKNTTQFRRSGSETVSQFHRVLWEFTSHGSYDVVRKRVARLACDTISF